MTTLNAPSLISQPFAAAEQDDHHLRTPRAVHAQYRGDKGRAAANARCAARTPGDLAERARIRAVLAIAAGVFAVAVVLAAFLLPMDLLGLGSLGITLTILLFGSPFWICAIDEAAEQAQQQAEADGLRGR